MNLVPPPSPLDHLRLASPEVYRPEPLAGRRFIGAIQLRPWQIHLLAIAVPVLALLVLARLFS